MTTFISRLSGKLLTVEICGAILLFFIIAAALFAPLLTPYAPRATVCEPFAAPVAAHILGCNDFGQDLWAQLLYGARTSLAIGIGVATLASVLATILAIIAGYSAGGNSSSRAWLDRIIMRSVDVTLALPFLPLVIVLGVYFGADLNTQILVLTLVMWAQPVRELRAQILQLRHNGYVEAAQTMGANTFFISTRHILPDLLPLIVPQFIRIAHNAILVEATLSFLGLGDPLRASWGSTLFHANARTAFLTGAWKYWVLPPGIAIALTVLALALIAYRFERRCTLHNIYRRRANVAADFKKGTNILEIVDLNVKYLSKDAASYHACKNISLNVVSGEILGLVGESGCGKTTLCTAILDLLPTTAQQSGSVYFNGVDIATLGSLQTRALRRKDIALIPQSAMNALNPVLTIGAQMDEVLLFSGRKDKKTRIAETDYWLQKVGLPKGLRDHFAHQLSGGMRQRVVIAMALCKKPQLIIADEPTTGLDVLVQAQIMDLLRQLKEEFKLTILLITHNLPLVMNFANRIAVMYAGELVELGTAQTISEQPRHAHSRALLASVLHLDAPKQAATTIIDERRQTIISVNNVSKSFTANNFLQRRANNNVLKNINFELHTGETVALVGASGAGKSTITRLLLGILRADSGKILFAGQDISKLNAPMRQQLCRDIHLVYQDPYQSLNPRYNILQLVAEPLAIAAQDDEAQRREKVIDALKRAQLPHDAQFLGKIAATLSGGQRQRVALARALVSNPRLIIADEPTSMLDQSVRMEVIEVMQNLKDEQQTGFLFITHDIALAHYFCDKIMVLKEGVIVESGEARTIIANPQHQYTKALIAASEYC